jgi:hypothetical protein
MTHPSASNPAQSADRPWLRRYHQARRQQTVDLVKATVDRLLQEGQTVTLEAVCLRSRELDPQGKGIKKAGVIGNTEAHAYYRKHSATYQRGLGQQRRKSRGRPVSATPSRIDVDRNVQRVRQRYLLQPKEELVERLLALEQDLGLCQQQLARLQFEVLDLQQQVEDAGRPMRTIGKYQAKKEEQQS